MEDNKSASGSSMSGFSILLYNGHGDVVQTADGAGNIQNSYEADLTQGTLYGEFRNPYGVAEEIYAAKATGKLIGKLNPYIQEGPIYYTDSHFGDITSPTGLPSFVRLK